jgi:RHS repeat-associated protein
VARATGSGRVIPARVRPQTSQTYYHRNQQYSIVGLTNAAGTLVERYTYSAYGTLGIYAANGTVRSSSTYANRYTYTGREWDAELRLYHFRARWYDPATGGFVARDPLGHVDGMSLYRGYFSTKDLDPLGREVWIVVRAFGSESCLGAAWNNSAHHAGIQSHFYLVVERADGRRYSFSFHPSCWASGMWDANRLNTSRIWCNDPIDLGESEEKKLADGLYSWYPIADGIGKEDQLIELILKWAIENGVGVEIGDHEEIDVNSKGVMQTRGSLYSRPNTDWNDGRLNCPYQVGATNCAWWSHAMLQKCNIKVDAFTQLHIGGVNAGVGPSIHLPSTDTIERIPDPAWEWGVEMFDWQDFVRSLCPGGGFYVGP